MAKWLANLLPDQAAIETAGSCLEKIAEPSGGLFVQNLQSLF